MATTPITDWSSLCFSAGDWLNRADLTDQIPVFVTLAEAGFNRELRVRDMMVRANTTSDCENLALPDDWLETYSLTLQPGAPPTPQNFQPAALRYMSEAESNDAKARAYGSSIGNPYGYTIIGNTIELVLAPSDDVDLRIVYSARIPNLGAAQASNWLLAKSPDLYLYSTLLQAVPYLKDDDRIQLWSQMRGGLMEAIRLESERALRPTSGLTARAKAF
jgi:hypothetical protein